VSSLAVSAGGRPLPRLSFLPRAADPWAAAAVLTALTLASVLARHPLTRDIGTSSAIPSLILPALPAAIPMPIPPGTVIITRPVASHPPRDPFRPDSGPRRSVTGHEGRGYRVSAGDSLWGIARRLEGTGATPSQTAALSRRLYVLNRAAIGSDPDRLTVGTTLVLPA